MPSEFMDTGLDHTHLITKQTSVPLCQGCGKAYSSLGRLQRHLVYSTSCVEQWGVFRPDTTPISSLHPQAPPEQVAGSLCGQAVCEDAQSMSGPLLRALQAAETDDESSLWEIVVDHIEPLEVLRATVLQWISQLDSPALLETAHNILLLLDPELLGDTPAQHQDKPHCPADIVADWPALPETLISVSAGLSSLCLECPPAVVLDPFGPSSITLRHATAYACWLEQACWCISKCLSGGSEAARSISCAGLERGLGPAAAWLKAIGATFGDEGLTFP